MPAGRTRKLSALILSNILIPVAVLVFASGFFPYKPFLPGLATREDGKEWEAEKSEAVFDRVVFMVVDALRSDFVYGYNSGFEFTQSLIRSGAAIPFTAHATPPTVTMPRVKALTTGSVPSFLDLILNFAESDTTSSLASQDTWLAQIRAKVGKLVFYGDDTWLKLFPGEFFERSDGTSSFFVSVSKTDPGLLIEYVAKCIHFVEQDFTEVDNNVTRHVPEQLKRDDWNAMIMHYLGLDHIGHKTGPQGPNMLPKQREMDGIVKMIFEAMEKHEHHSKTLLILAGDHGMNAGGNHGGSGPGETEPALLFASPKFSKMSDRPNYDCPTLPKEGTEFHFYNKVEQSDLVPVLSGLMDTPIPKNNLGVFIPELSNVWPREYYLRHLHKNSKQLLGLLHAKYDQKAFDEKASMHANALSLPGYPCHLPNGDEDELAYKWGQVMYNLEKEVDHEIAETDYYEFLNHAQKAMSDTASSYNVGRMVVGMVLAAASLITAAVSLPSLWLPSGAGVFVTLITLLYGVMMFASSYVEEEQHFWYWITPVWILLLTVQRLSNRAPAHHRMQTALAGAVLLFTHRIAVRWNQTGQKHAGDPDIVHTIFPEHHILMWTLTLISFVANCVFLHTTTFAGILMNELAVFLETSLTFLAIVFKLNFTQADAPELVQGLAILIRQYSEPFSLVEQARAVFALLAFATIAVVVLSISQSRRKTTLKADEAELQIPLTERLHHLLMLFLIVQTRTPNVPLFLALELQRVCLSWLTSNENSDPPSPYASPTKVATSALLLSNVSYFCMGGSNSISSIDLSNAYNGVADYSIAAVGVLLFASNWAGAIWACSAAVLLLLPRQADQPEEPTKRKEDDRDWVIVERQKLHNDAVASLKAEDHDSTSRDGPRLGLWLEYIAVMTSFISSSLLAVMAACTALRTHLFIWTVFSPKYLYAMAWAIGWHLAVNIGLGSVLYGLGQIY